MLAPEAMLYEPTKHSSSSDTVVAIVWPVEYTMQLSYHKSLKDPYEIYGSVRDSNVWKWLIKVHSFSNMSSTQNESQADLDYFLDDLIA